MDIEVTWSAPEAGFGITASQHSLTLWVEDEDGKRKTVGESWEYFLEDFYPMFKNAKDLHTLQGLLKYEEIMAEVQKEWEDDVRLVVESCCAWGMSRTLEPA